jgi:peptide/nickel transport system permease protein
LEVILNLQNKIKSERFQRFISLFFKNKLAVFASIILLLLLISAIFAPWISPFNWEEQDVSKRLIAPGHAAHILGTDFMGRDMLSYIIYGAKVSIIVGVATVLVGGILGSVLGWIAGFFGGWADRIIMRLADIQLSFPYILLTLALAAVVGPGLWNVILVLGISSWPVYGRIARGSMLSEKEKEHVEAARALGFSSYRVLVYHAIPSTISPLIVVTTLQVGRMIIAEATLSFLGLGVPTTVPTWGGLLSDGKDYLYNAWWIATFPGLAIMFTVMMINIIGDSLRDILDPKSL